jgi:hypothetical protein
MSEQPGTEPFQTLGTHLRYLREQLQESLAEVSGAVEIDEAALERIESGRERPAEDILLLMISHFNMQDQEAVQLWELAGYDGEVPGHGKTDDDSSGPQNSKPFVVLLAIDARTMYTDGADITANQAGITMHFTQANGQKQPLPVARLGMSYEQAYRVLQGLQQALLRSKYMQGPKALPPANDQEADAK